MLSYHANFLLEPAQAVHARQSTLAWAAKAAILHGDEHKESTSGEPRGKYNGWHIDHDHVCCPHDTTCGERVRGILCSDCKIRGVT
ncbi:endonuclease domain-containing protein [Streptomyces sp. TLI_146]|uniref:endonuclease domain-containing protein n=1 Tax=Streptomyces sp. TLI_146 TaxID=1938858 RepID=UPI0015D5B368